MSMKPRTFVMLIGGILICVGLFFGLKPTTVPMSDGSTASCGSAISPNATVANDFGDIAGFTPIEGGTPTHRCETALSSNRTLMLVILGVGVLVLIGGAVVRNPQPA